MSIPIAIDIANADPSVAPATLNDLIAQLRLLITAEITDSITPYILSADTPGVDDQDKVWHRIDETGRPFGTYIFWNGLWVLEPPPLASQIGWFNGDPTIGFDGNGTGLAGPGPIAYDVFGWQIMNGHNGVANLSDRFIIAGRMDNFGITGYDADSSSWRTNVTGEPLTAGGESTITLDVDTTYVPHTDALGASHYTADGNARGDTGAIWGTEVSGESTFTVIPATVGNESPAPISIVNPFYCLAMIQWIGYQDPAP